MTAEVNDMAPDFELPSHNDRKVKLSDFRGKKKVFIAFYPLAWTPVWTVQMPSYQADLSRFEGYDTQVLGISVDSVPCNKAWAKSLGGISYDLLSDFEPKGEVAKKYGVYRPEGYSERALFVIDKEGRIVYKDIHKIDEQPDNEEIFEILRKAW